MYDDYLYKAFGGIFGEIFGMPDESNINEFEEKLDLLWESYQIDRYYKIVERVKSKGLRIFRNSLGKHRVIKNG